MTKTIRIAIYGESCIDKFTYCRTNRLSPEAPVPVLEPQCSRENEGMAGNVLRNIEALDPTAMTHMGTNVVKPTKERYIDEKSNHMFLRVDRGSIYDKFEGTKNPESLKKFLQRMDIVIVSDYNKGFLSNDDLKFIGEHSPLSILDSKRVLSKDIAEKFSWVKLNRQEALNNSHIMDDDNVIVTLGSQGAMWNNKLYPAPKPIETIDVSGAGDTFTASFIYKYYQSNNPKVSITYANEQAGKVVQNRGVATP